MPPPDLSMLSQMAQQGPPDQGGPEQISVNPNQGAQGPPDDQGSQSGADLLSEMLDIAAQYKDGEQDQEDLLQIEKVTTLIQQLLAKQQKESDGMMQGKATPSALRRALGNGAGY